MVFSMNPDLYKSPRRFHLRFYDTQIIWDTFKDLSAAKNVGASLKFIKSDLEVYDSKHDKIVYTFSGGNW